jgi:hypothetical protein
MFFTVINHQLKGSRLTLTLSSVSIVAFAEASTNRATPVFVVFEKAIFFSLGDQDKLVIFCVFR